MKWMLSTASAVLIVSAVVGAQRGKDMAQTGMNDKAKTAYTGCVVAVNHGGEFLLTDVSDTGRMSMPGDTMMKDDAMMKDDGGMKKKEQIVLTGSADDLKKHVGQKVSVTGSLSHGSMSTMGPDRPTLTVKSLKVVAKSCAPDMR